MAQPYLQDRILEMKQALLDNGVSLTPRREKLLEVLIASDKHPSASEIHQGVKKYYPGTSLATIYNTIELLKDTGQVLEIEFSGAANRYDGRIPDSHPHLICLDCERVDDLHLPDNDGHLDEIAKATGYRIVRRRTDYYGICPECQNKQGGAAQSKGGDSTPDP